MFLTVEWEVGRRERKGRSLGWILVEFLTLRERERERVCGEES